LDSEEAKESRSSDQDNGANANLKSEWGKSSFKLLMAGTLALAATYSHFFGVSYLNGKMTVMGFEGIAFELSSGQSMQLAVEGYLNGLVMSTQYLFSFNAPLGFLSLLMGLAITYWHFRKPLSGFWVTFNEKVDKRVQVSINLPLWVLQPVRFFSFIMLPILSVVWSYSALMLLFAALILVIGLTVTFVGLGSIVGHKIGTDMISQPICYASNLDKQRELGCRLIELKDGSQLQGMRVFSQSGVDYILTNDGAYEVKDQAVLSYKPIYCKEHIEQATTTAADREQNTRCSSKPYVFKVEEEQ
jgi:hypothetical protein